MYQSIQKALLKGDYLAAAQLCQQAIDNAVNQLTSASDDAMLTELECRTQDKTNDARLWYLIQDLDPLVKEYLPFMPDTDLLAALGSTDNVLRDADDSDLWDAMSYQAQKDKAREYYADNIDIGGLKDLLKALEG
jgi:hypothetical protein